MNKRLIQIILIVAMLSMASMSFAHELLSSHDSFECSTCIYKPLSDPHNPSSEQENSFVASISNLEFTIDDLFVVNPLFVFVHCRAPPSSL